MRRGVAAAAALAVVTAGAALLMRPLVHSLRADKITVNLGIRPAPSARARAVDEGVLAAIESGSFGAELRLRLDRPARTVRLDPFLIDRCEVRQIDFERFAQWHRTQDAGAAGGRERMTSALLSSSTGHRVAGRLDSPATGVDFFGASLYCEAARGRLPRAEELEAAAGGKEGRLYAWGDDFDPGAWPYLDGYRNASRPCGSYPPSDSPEGVHDLNGNAMEWSAGSIAVSAGVFRQPAAHGAPAVRTRGRGLYALNAGVAAHRARDPEPPSRLSLRLRRSLAGISAGAVVGRTGGPPGPDRRGGISGGPAGGRAPGAARRDPAEYTASQRTCIACVHRTRRASDRSRAVRGEPPRVRGVPRRSACPRRALREQARAGRRALRSRGLGAADRG